MNRIRALLGGNATKRNLPPPAGRADDTETLMGEIAALHNDIYHQGRNCPDNNQQECAEKCDDEANT